MSYHYNNTKVKDIVGYLSEMFPDEKTYFQFEYQSKYDNKLVDPNEMVWFMIKTKHIKDVEIVAVQYKKSDCSEQFLLYFTKQDTEEGNEDQAKMFSDVRRMFMTKTTTTNQLHFEIFK